jgi:S-adenosylmethionine-diacylglycerol 3-amino-3-carboxypropyl transferase
MTNHLLERAAVSRPIASKRGLLERLFTLMFQGFVYNQIWEDPAVDLEALALAPHHHLVTIASGGCNILNYLAASPARISAVDLNSNHVALALLKLAALRHLPSHAEFFRFFGEANDALNAKLFDRHLASTLDAQTLAYWNQRLPLGGRRIEMFSRDLYRHGLLGRFIGVLHGVARLHGKRLERMLAARDLDEQRAAFDSIIAPLFESAPVRLLSKSPVSLYALGIPPAQYEALVEGGDAITVLRERTRRLACDFPIAENYFAWQAFGRGYDLTHRQAVPDYLRADNFETLRARAGSAQVQHASLTDFLRRQPPASLHRFVLLDAQDWMNEVQLTELWTEIDRSADSRDARVIFRTAGQDSPLPRKLPPALLAPWVYREAESRLLHARDRSSIYGGFHLYVRGALQ